MITAKEARELYEQSNEQMVKRLEQIGEKVIDAAKLGKTELWLTDVFYHHPEYVIEKIPFRNAELTPLQILIKKELIKLGYSFDIKTREVQIGGGLGSMDDEVKFENLPYLRLTW